MQNSHSLLLSSFKLHLAFYAIFNMVIVLQMLQHLLLSGMFLQMHRIFSNTLLSYFLFFDAHVGHKYNLHNFSWQTELKKVLMFCDSNGAHQTFLIKCSFFVMRLQKNIRLSKILVYAFHTDKHYFIIYRSPSSPHHHHIHQCIRARILLFQ